MRRRKAVVEGGININSYQQSLAPPCFVSRSILRPDGHKNNSIGRDSWLWFLEFPYSIDLRQNSFRAQMALLAGADFRLGAEGFEVMFMDLSRLLSNHVLG